MFWTCFRSLLVFTLILISWEYYSRALDEMLFVLPAPSRIVMRVWESWDRFGVHTLYTIKEILGGIAIAFAVAFPLAWIMYLWNTARAILQPIFVVIQCIPMFALAPIMVIWFDWSYTAIVIPTALMIFFPLTMNIYQGLKSVPRHFLDYFRINQASSWQIFSKLQLPWAIPHICSGLRISAAIAGIGAVAGEWAGAQSGLGILMIESRRGADLEATFGAFLCLTTVSLALYGLTLLLEQIIYFRGYLRTETKGCVAALLLFAVVLSGCQSRDENNSQTRLLLDWLPNPNHIPLFVGVEKGYFKNHGIDINIQKLHDPSHTTPYITSGQTELAISYMSHTIRSIARGADIEPIAKLIGQPLNCVIYHRDSQIKSPKDLNGKVIGFCSDGSASQFLYYLLSVNNIIPKELRNVNFDMVGTLGTRRVDAVYGGYWNIEEEQLRSFGINTNHISLADFGVPHHYELIVIARKGTKEAHIAFTEPFKEALAESVRYCKEHPAEAFAIYLECNPDKGEKTKTWERRSWELTYPLLADDPTIDQGVWDKFKNWLKDNGLLEKNLTFQFRTATS